MLPSYDAAVSESDVSSDRDRSSGDLLSELQALTGVDYSSFEVSYRSFIAGALTDVQNTKLADRLSDIHNDLTNEFVVGKIRAVDAWANGETAFNILQKSWDSVVDKLYRFNVEENEEPSTPPSILSIEEQATRETYPTNQQWVTPNVAHRFADDLLRTKFVVPFVDGVVDVSERVTAVAKELELPFFRRYHAKDSGYHAHHIYALLPTIDFDGQPTAIALEIKILTKLQDTLGELTHLLYELKRTGKLKSEKKRKLAWNLESPDFEASYIGHSAHYIEASMVRLKKTLALLTKDSDEGAADGEP